MTIDQNDSNFASVNFSQSTAQHTIPPSMAIHTGKSQTTPEKLESQIPSNSPRMLELRFIIVIVDRHDSVQLDRGHRQSRRVSHTPGVQSPEAGEHKCRSSSPISRLLRRVSSKLVKALQRSCQELLIMNFLSLALDTINCAFFTIVWSCSPSISYSDRHQ